MSSPHFYLLQMYTQLSSRSKKWVELLELSSLNQAPLQPWELQGDIYQTYL